MNTKNLKSTTLICLIAIILGFSSCSSDDTIENRAPNAFDLTQPAEGTEGINLQPQLSWEAATDPDGDSVSYEVLVDTENPPQKTITSNLGVNTFTLETELDPETTYYWKVNAKDSHDNTTGSTVKSFTTRDMTASEAIIGKWYFESVENEPELDECFKKSYLKFNADLELFMNEYGLNNEDSCTNYSNGSSYTVIGEDKIELKINGEIQTWKIRSLGQDTLILEVFEDFVLTLKKE